MRYPGVLERLDGENFLGRSQEQCTFGSGLGFRIVRVGLKL